MSKTVALGVSFAASACTGLSACGRLGYDDAAAMADATAADAHAWDAESAPVSLRFGENISDDVTGVTRDTILRLQHPGRNYGVTDHISVSDVNSTSGLEVGLLRFDLDRMPQAAEVVSAELSISTFDVAVAGEIAIHAVLEKWEEGEEHDELGTANWNHRLPNTDWSVPGGFYDPEPVAELVITAELVKRYRVPLPVEVVQRWVSDPEQNFGIRLSRDQPDHTHFVSVDNALNQNRPSLAVAYRIPSTGFE